MNDNEIADAWTTQIGDTQYQIKKIDSWQIFVMVMCIILIMLYVVYNASTQLGKRDIELMSDIMENFHIDPDYDDFIHIWKNRNNLIKQTGRPVKFWLYGIYLTQPQFYDETKVAVVQLWIREIERTIRRVARAPTAESMDCIWSLYFATGDELYSNVIKNIAANNANITTIRDAARWSYNNIMKRDWNAILPEIVVEDNVAEQLGPQVARRVQQTEDHIVAE